MPSGREPHRATLQRLAVRAFQLQRELPASDALGGLVVGAGRYEDAGSQNYPAVVNLVSTSTIGLFRSDAPFSGSIGTDPNIAVASTDQFYATLVHEAA